MGLFGTVVGMIEIFGSPTVLGYQPAGPGTRHLGGALQHRFRPDHRHSGMIFHSHFRAQVDGFLIEMEQEAVKLVEVMHGERK
jgi:biopolymer transport protein ExbB